MEEIEGFQREQGVDRSVMVWCGSTEMHMEPSAVHESLDAFEAGLRPATRRSRRA